MSKIFLVIALWLASLSTFAQSDNNCSCNLLINPSYYGQITLYKKPYGNVLKMISNDSVKEDYLTVTVDIDSADYFHVIIQFAISGRQFNGWITKAKYLGTFSRNYVSDLVIYSDANKLSKVKSIYHEYLDDFCPVVSCHEKWVYINLTGKSKKIEGWVAPEMQCANPYTTCN